MSNLKKLLVLIPIFILIIDIINHYFIPESLGVLIRAIVLYLLFLYFIINRKYIVIDKAYISFLIFFIYTFFNSLLNSTNLNITISGCFAIFISSSYYLISYNNFIEKKDIMIFQKWFIIIPLLYLLNLIIFSGLGIGEPVYGVSSALRFGNLHHSRIYSGSIIILLFLIINKYSNLKLLNNILISILLVIIILSMRRTAILIVLFGFFVYFLLYSKKSTFQYLFISLLILTVTFPLYKKQMYDVLEQRSSRVSLSEETIEEETRYLEVIVVTNKIFSFSDLKYSFFGTEYLNSIGTYSTPEIKMSDDRILHTDYAVIIHGAGIIGLFLYSLYSLMLFLPMYYQIKTFGIKNDISVVQLMLFITFVLVTISGSILNITFRTIFFIILGSLNRISLESIKYNRKNESSFYN